MKKLLTALFSWVFKSKLQELDKKFGELDYKLLAADKLLKQLKVDRSRVMEVLDGIDVSVDVHEYHNQYSPSWAVISVQGLKTDYIKFVDMTGADAREIAQFLRRYENLNKNHVKIDASPTASEFLRIKR